MTVNGGDFGGPEDFLQAALPLCEGSVCSDTHAVSHPAPVVG
jgi:hypothetical protein